MTDITVSRELLRHVLDSCEPEANNEQQMLAYDALRAALEQPNQFQPDWDQVKPFLDRIAELEAAQPRKDAKLAEVEKDAARYQWLVAYFVSDGTEHDDAIVAASEVDVASVTAVIDDAMGAMK